MASKLSYAIDLSQNNEHKESEEHNEMDSPEDDSFLIYESNMNHAISFLNDLEIPGFIFGCVAECTEFGVSVDYSVLIDAARKTEDHDDDIGLAIITDIWGFKEIIPQAFKALKVVAARDTMDLVQANNTHCSFEWINTVIAQTFLATNLK